MATNQKIKIVINGRPLKTNTVTKIEGGKAVAPVREIAEALGADVKWDNDTKTINIKSKKDAMEDEEGINVDIEESAKFNKGEIIDAVISVKNNFNFPASTLTKIWYNEEESDKFTKLYLENGKGLNSEIKPENIIVLLSNFDVDDSGDNPILNSGSTYENYQWVLIRDNKTSKWKVDSWGY